MIDLQQRTIDYRVDDVDEVAEAERALARKRVEKRRGLQGAMVAFVVVNGFLIAVWALTGGGYFWPAWILGLWGAGMLLGTWDYFRGPVTEADIDRELQRIRRG